MNKNTVKNIYRNRNIGLFSVAPDLVIALPTLR